MKPTYEELERERNEMAAQVEQAHAFRNYAVAKLLRLQSEVKGVIYDSAGVAGYHLNGQVAEWDEFAGLMEIIDEPPDTSLAALKAQWLAEAVESICNLDYGYIQFEDGSFAFTAEAISGYAESIRQRAQESGDE